MFIQAKRYVFLIAIYLSGIVIGGAYTPVIVTYAEQMNAQEDTIELPTKPQQIKKRFSRRQQLG